MLSLATLFPLAPPESAGWVRSQWLQPGPATPLSANAAMAVLLPPLHRKESLTNRLIESMDKKMQSDEQIETQGEERGGGVEEREGGEGGENDYEQDSGGTRREGRGDRILQRQLNTVFTPEC